MADLTEIKPSRYELNRASILAKAWARRRLHGVPIGRGGARAGSGRKRTKSRREIKCERADCGVVFTTLNEKQRCCSTKCSATVIQPVASLKRRTRMPRPCRLCSQPFTPKYPAKIFCSQKCATSYQRQQAWLRAPETTAALRARRRRSSEKRRALGERHEKGRTQRICERDGWICQICREPIDPSFIPWRSRSASVDHVVPLSRGGSDDDANLRAAHQGCNSRRGNRADA